MKKHMKRQKVPKKWGIQRKGKKYVVRPSSNLSSGVPLLIALREMIGVAKNRKEVKRALQLGNVLLNGKKTNDEKKPILLFETIKIVPSKKNYRLNLSANGKFILEEISEKEADLKISKIIGKKILKGKKEQLNFLDGRNFLSNMKCEMGDSAVINLKEKKIQSHIPLKEKSDVVVFSGKHSGKKGKITQIKKENKTAELDTGKEKINVLIKQIIAVK